MGLETKSLRYAHVAGHTDVCYGTDNKYIITCGSDGNVRIFEGPDDDDPSADSVSEAALAVVSYKDQFLVATDSNYVQAFNYSDRKRDRIFFRFSAPVTHVALSPSSKFLAAGSCDMEIQVLNIETNKISVLSGHTAPVLGVSLDPLDDFIASSSCDGTIKVWSLEDMSLVKTFTNMVPLKNDFFKADVLGRTAWKSISGSILAVPRDLEVIAYKRHTWEVAYTLKSKQVEKAFSAVLFSPCGNYLAAASISGDIIIWEIKFHSAVCHYKDPKKVSISGFVWHSNGSEIAYADRLGRFGILTGIDEEISKHVVPEENMTERDINVDDLMDAETLFDNDDDEDNENCISLDKIKASYQNESDGEGPGSPATSSSSNRVIEPAINFSKPQPPFQPSSTPAHFEPRCLCFNSIGIVRYYDADSTIDVQFHDTMFHHALFFRSFGVCTIAALSKNVLCLAVPSIDDNLSKITCLPLSSWGGSKEWTVHMPENEDIMAVAAGGNLVAVATSAKHMRIFTFAGTQKQIISLPGPIVCLAAYEQKILAVCHSGPGIEENQNECFIMYQVSNLHVRALNPVQPLPLYPKSVLRWAGFTDEGTPAVYDSEGIVKLLSNDSLHWEVACDTRIQKKSPSDHYFIVGLNERYQNIRCVLCRNSHYPLIINTPTVLEIPLKLPLCGSDSEKSIQEEIFWRLMFSFHNLIKCSEENNEYEDDVNNFEKTLKQTALKLFAEACRNSDDIRALDVASLMSSHPLEMATKYASKVGKLYLMEKLSEITPLDWKNQFLEMNEKEGNESAFNNFDKSVYSQQDLFEDKTEVFGEKENKSEAQTNGSNHLSIICPELKKSSSSNPFKKVKVQEKEQPKGLKFFDTVTKENQKTNKSNVLIKPLKLKPLGNNKDKASEAKCKKPTFVQWFSTQKASLSEEYPNISASELTKLGMKIYKEKVSGANSEGKPEGTVLDSKKRSFEEENDEESKK